MPTPKWTHRLAVATAIATWFLLNAGALVTSTGSGLSVPDWPLSYGQWMPPMVGGVFFEHGHRMIAGGVAFLTVVLAFFASFTEPRGWVRALAYSGVCLVLLQAVLGGLTVLLRLPTSVSVSHAMLGQTFFCVTVLIAVVTSPDWDSRVVGSRPQDASLFRFSGFLSLGFFFQLFLGASVRHLHAGLAIPDFPTVYGGFLPPFWTAGVAFHFLHRILAYALSVGAVVLSIRILRLARPDLFQVRVVKIWLSLLVLQIALGALTIWLRRPVPVTSLHLAVGALCLAASVLLTFRLGAVSWLVPRTVTRRGEFAT